ncbi:MAG: thioredoxin-dependent thiol peroxidase [Rhodobacterales bacterium]|nr:thioredoxin-dependent thiol peroxidase [Rhodobacterales bacterium]
MSLQEGDTVPEFSLPTDGGGTLSRADLKGGKAVIYFYPKDMTSGCTTEAEGFRDAIADFQAAGTRVVGVSKDSVKRHDNFKAKHDLPFTLISDADGTLCEAFGVWVEKSMYGRKYMGIERATFLVDGDGVIRQAWRKVKVTGHVAAVLKAAQAL